MDGRELVAGERDIPEASLRIARGIDVIVLHPPGCGDLYAVCLDEGGQGARDAQSSAC
jgi:hypothetical protein